MLYSDLPSALLEQIKLCRGGADVFSTAFRPESTAAGKANSSTLTMVWGSSPALGFMLNIPELPSAGHVGKVVCIQPCQWTLECVGCAILQVCMSGREEYVVYLKSNLIYAFVWGTTCAYNPVTTHHGLGKSLENPRSVMLCEIVASLCFQHWPGGGSLCILLLLMLDCSPVCELLWDVCGDCVLSLLEIVKKMKRTGGVLGQNGNANPQHVWH